MSLCRKREHSERPSYESLCGFLVQKGEQRSKQIHHSRFREFNRALHEVTLYLEGGTCDARWRSISGEMLFSGTATTQPPQPHPPTSPLPPPPPRGHKTAACSGCRSSEWRWNWDSWCTSPGAAASPRRSRIPDRARRRRPPAPWAWGGTENTLLQELLGKMGLREEGTETVTAPDPCVEQLFDDGYDLVVLVWGR